MTTYDAVLFDNDGVLVEPPARETQAAATRDAFREVGVEQPDPDHVDAVVSGVTRESVDDICATYGLDPERFWAARERHDEQSQLAAFRAGERGCYSDIEALDSLSVPCGVVSNNHHSTIRFILDFFDLGAQVESFHGREKTLPTLALKKPNPHYIDRARAELGVDSALYVGDSESDVVAAERAGLDSAFLRRSHNDDATLPTTPTYEIESLQAVPALVSARSE